MFASQRTPEWLKERRGKVTASVAGTIIGVNKHSTAKNLWEEMTGIKEPFCGNYFTWYGTKNEPNALNEYMIQSMHHVQPAGFVQHKHYAWLGGSPDGLVDGDGVVEFKCPNPKAKSMYTDTTIPLHYYVQCQVLMEVTNRMWCDLFVWTPEENRTWRFSRDQQFFDDICPTLAVFHANVHNRQEPCDIPASFDIVQFTKDSMAKSMRPIETTSTSPFSKR